MFPWRGTDRILKAKMDCQRCGHGSTPALKVLMNPTFSAVYELLLRKGPGRATLTRGTIYRIEARDGNILAFPRSGRITVHKDCCRQEITCQGTHAGCIYNEPYTIVDLFIGRR